MSQGTYVCEQLSFYLKSKEIFCTLDFIADKWNGFARRARLCPRRVFLQEKQDTVRLSG